MTDRGSSLLTSAEKTFAHSPFFLTRKRSVSCRLCGSGTPLLAPVTRDRLVLKLRCQRFRFSASART
ncbi:hypothetical protein E2C01_098585 [Portunus trituberculatus]|uniref:Uncharacterized protein n=1 Tax=Portunus trituberculatus TaxID=210409 RepID=A0A5B7K8M6_PORTR|nr:hypothetical protein [Portunus trituberculatus]